MFKNWKTFLTELRETIRENNSTSGLEKRGVLTPFDQFDSGASPLYGAHISEQVVKVFGFEIDINVFEKGVLLTVYGVKQEKLILREFLKKE